MGGLRLALVVILALSTAVFAAGVIAERSEGGERAEPARMHQEAGAESDAADNAAAGTKQAERVLGVDLESTPLIVLAIVAGLGLTAVAATSLGRASAVLLAIAFITLAWAALDVRELVHQVDESHDGVAVAAAFAAALHLTAAALSGVLAARAREDRDRSSSSAGTMLA